MNSLYKTLRNETWILIICSIAFVLRMRGLEHQSLWMDELHTMNEAAPSTSWGEMFHYLKTGDQHPPLYFIIEKISFSIFGHTAFAARIFSVIAGTISVWAMYRLGKEILNKRLGIICAVITCINFYNISYSQEARPYIFAFLFAALSFTWFIKLIKSPTKKNAILYSVFTLLLLYSHYYSLFVAAAQGILALLFIFQERGADRKKLFRFLMLGFLITVVGYMPWFSFFITMSQIKSFWITDIQPAFLQNFFYEYFGNADLLNPLLLLLLLLFCIKVTLSTEIQVIKKIKDNPLLLSFTIILFWVFVVILVPYVRSLLVVPMLYPRYTIVILPAIILALAYGIELFKIPILKYLLISLFVLLSCIHLFFVKKYYTGVSKTQFREMTQYLVNENTSDFPVFNERTAWHQGYYLRLFGSKEQVFSGKKEDLVDSVLRKGTEKYDLRGFWIVGAHGDKMLDNDKRKALDTAYALIKQKEFFDAWAQFYVSQKYQEGNYYIIHHTDFMPGEGQILPGQKHLSIWNGAVHSLSQMVKKGKYKLTITAMGTVAGKLFPHLNIYSNGKKIGDYYVTDRMEEREFELDNAADGNIVFKIEMDNDLFIPGQNEDRNVFLESIVLKIIK